MTKRKSCTFWGEKLNRFFLLRVTWDVRDHCLLHCPANNPLLINAFPKLLNSSFKCLLCTPPSLEEQDSRKQMMWLKRTLFNPRLLGSVPLWTQMSDSFKSLDSNVLHFNSVLTHVIAAWRIVQHAAPHAWNITYSFFSFESEILSLLGLKKSDQNCMYRQTLSNTGIKTYPWMVKSGDYIFRYFPWGNRSWTDWIMSINRWQEVTQRK